MERKIVNKILILLLVIFTGLIQLQAWSTPPPRVQNKRISAPPIDVDKQLEKTLKLYHQGIRYLNDLDWAPAEQYLKQAITQAEPLKDKVDDNLYPDLYGHTGFVVLRLGKTDEAKLYLNKAHALNPNRHPVQMLASEVAKLDDSPDYIRYHGKEIYRWTELRKEIYIYIPPQEPVKMDLVKQAFLEWQQAIDNQFVFIFVDNSKASDLSVNWVNNIIAEDDGATAAGMFQFEHDKRYFTRADLNMALFGLEGAPITKAEMYNAALHEIGHMFGLEHSPSPADLMYPTSSVPHPAKRDVATFHALYHMKPDYTNHPKMTVAAYGR